jgi:cytochrome oxidase assembly protein ShyY1
VYRFLLTPRWLGLAALTLVLAGVMGGLGDWQLHRYRDRSAINDRVDAAAHATPVPVTDVLPVGTAPAADRRYTRVTLVGKYDPANEILVRSRTVEGNVGFEVLTPLVLADGSAVLVDRGWVAPARESAAAEPKVPAAPVGEVSLTGNVFLPERATGAVERRAGRLHVRRISPSQLAAALPYPVRGGYVTVAQEGLRQVPVERENAWQNGGYVAQWWAFALMTLYGYVYLARREASGPVDGTDRVDRVGVGG